MKFLTLEQFTEMWKLQDQLNTQTSGPNWKEKNQNWNLAIKAEVMEFFDYIGWKWWKEPNQTKKPSDMQARLELVDIWHFLLSSSIETSTGLPAITEYNRFASSADVDPNSLEGCLAAVQGLDGKASNGDKVMYMTDALQLCEWSWEELYKAYIGKVALNAFRQANGYKEGTYQKIWDSYSLGNSSNGAISVFEKEDNYFLEQILTELSLTPGALTYQAVYHKLGIEYMCRTQAN